MQIKEVLQDAANAHASDIFLVAGTPVTLLIGKQQERRGDALNSNQIKGLITEIYAMASRPVSQIEKKLDDDFSVSVPSTGRFRVNVFIQRGSLAAVIKVIHFGIPDAESVGVTENIMSMTDTHRGLILVTGEAGSGRSTTIACMIDRINKTRQGHIVTLENPIEFTHRHGECIVSQREVFIDTKGYKEGLRAALREKPGVIFMSEVVDDAVPDILTASETGVLLISSMYTTSAVATIERFLDAFPAAYRAQAQNRLSQALAGIVCQRLVKTVDGKIVPVFEVLKTNPVIKDMIRKDHLTKLEAVIQASDDMVTMDDSLMKLYTEKKITKEDVLNNCTHYDVMTRLLGL